MASRTTAQSVKEVLMRDYDHDNQPSLTMSMKTANVFISRVITCAATKGITLTTDELEILETWLAAHFYKVSDRAYAANSTLDASATYDGKTAMYLEATLYGQQAVLLDQSGCVAQVAEQGRVQEAGITWLGKPVSEQIPHDQRN